MNNIVDYISRKSAEDELPFIPAHEVKQRNGRDNADLCTCGIKSIFDNGKRQREKNNTNYFLTKGW